MNCKNCGKELNENENFCSNCGTEQEKEVITDGVQQPTKKSNKLILGFLLIIILAILVCAGVFYFMNTTPKAIFEKAINAGFDGLEESLENLNISKQKVDLELSANIETKDEEVKAVADIVNEILIKLNVQQDTEKKDYILGVNVEYKDETMIDANAYADIDKEKVYVYVEDLYDEYFELDIEGYLEEIDEGLTENQIKNAQNALRISEKEVIKNLKDEYFTKTTEEINVNGKSVKANKSTLTMNQVQFVEFMKNIINNLKANQEFLNCFEDMETIEDELENLLEEMEDIDSDEEIKTSISIYTQGLLNKFVKFEFAVIEDEEETKLSLIKISDEEYDIEMTDGSTEETVKAKLIIKEISENEAEVVLKMDVEELGNLEIKAKTKVTLNEDIDKIDTEDAVDVNKLTEKDMLEIQENLQDMPIYQIISMYAGDLGLDTGIEPDIDTTTDETTTSNDLQANSIETYNDNVVEYIIPTNYEFLSNYSADTYKFFEKEDVNLTVKCRYSKPEEYKNYLDTYANNLKQSFTNVKLEKADDIIVDGKTFTVYDLTYEYVSGSYSKKYLYKHIFTKVDNYNLYVLEIENPEGMTESEMKDFLTITVK